MAAILLGIGMFMFLVVIHELGHFTAAKKTGVHVHEFGIGIPPKVTKLRKDAGGTEYTINWLPLGGFVRLKGEDPSDDADFLAKDSFITASLGSKILILIAGVVVNTIFALIAFSAAFWMGVKPIVVTADQEMTKSQSYLVSSPDYLKKVGLLDESIPNEFFSHVVVKDIEVGGLGESLGLEVGDIVQKIGGIDVTRRNILEVLAGQESEISLIVNRGGNQVELSGACLKPGCLLQIRTLTPYEYYPEISVGFIKGLMMGAHEISAQTKITLKALGQLGSNLFSFNKKKIAGSVDNLSGPVGIVAFGQRLFYERGRVVYLAFSGMISLALAIFNILPIPALDGGRILSVLIQTIGKFPVQKYFVIENYINVFFFVILMLLGLFIIYKDIIRLPTF